MTILKRSTALLLTLIMLLSFAACDTVTTDSATVFPETGTTTVTTTRNTADSVTLSAVSLDAIPAYSGEPFIFINDNVPFFTDAEKGVRAGAKQFGVFASSRIGTYFLEVFINLAIIKLFEVFGYVAITLTILKFSLELTSRFWAKLFSSVLVVISNYYISKLLVFRKKRRDE